MYFMLDYFQQTAILVCWYLILLGLLWTLQIIRTWARSYYSSSETKVRSVILLLKF